METVNNLTSAASRVIWGDPANTETSQQTSTSDKQEPIAGEMGNVSAGEPYDKGNQEESPITKSNANDDLQGKTPSTLPIRSEHETEKTGVTSLHTPNSGLPTSSSENEKLSSSNTTSDSGPNPSVGAVPSSGSTEESNIRERKDDTEGPTEGSAEHEGIVAAKKEAEEAASVDVSGPGPRTLEKKAKDSPASGAGVGGSGGKGGDGEDGPQKESHGEGTGEKYVKSSGMVADGGDFDASNPGAGKEADRLLETKGIHHTPGKAEPPAAEDTSTNSSTGNGKEGKDGKEKVSLKDKIKAKLHKS